MSFRLSREGALASRASEEKLDERLPFARVIFVFLVLCTIVFGIAYAFPVFGLRYPDYGHLGAEYFNIANALAHGRGFADPFGQPSGPTSWMPPLFCLFLAGLILLFKSKALVAVAVAVCTNFAWAFVGTVLYIVSRRHCTKLNPGVAPAIFVAWLCVFYTSYFLFTHDIWFIGLFVSFNILHISTHVHTGTLSRRYWGFLGGCSALVSPSLAIAWASYTIGLILRRPTMRKQLYVAVALAGLVTSPWIIRNAIVFHRFIPTKSNLGFDEYQAHKIDDDGVYDDWSFQQHPYSSLRSRREYALEGESQYVDRYRRAFARSISHRPGAYLKRVGRRMLASTLAYPPADIRDATGFGHAIRTCLYALPFLCAVLTLSLRTRHQTMLAAMRLTYFPYILPYWFFAFYVRHLFPLTIVLVLFIVLAIDQLLAIALQRRLRPVPRVGGQPITPGQ